MPLVLMAMATLAQGRLVPVNLKCELLVNPCGIDVTKPNLSYNLISTNDADKNLHQTAYQVWVSADADFKEGGDLWDSKKVATARMAFIAYGGKQLKSAKKYWWKVRVWDGKGEVSGWSKPGMWIMGLLNPADWDAKWISAKGAEKYAHKYKSARNDFNLGQDFAEFRANKPAITDPNFSSMMVRKTFQVKSALRHATIYISGLGQYQLTVNGKKVGDQILSSGLTDYHKTILYDTYDITKQLQTGSNAVGVMLGNGIYNIMPDSVRYVKFLSSFGPLKMIATLKLEYTDGSTQTIGSNQSWQVSPGPVTYSNFYGGEDYDARLEPQDWNTATFKKSAGWADAIACPSPGGAVKGLSCAAPPIKAIENLTPVKVVKLKPDLLVYDLGQNASIMPEISVKGTRGAFIRIIPSELLKPDGTVDRSSVCQGEVMPAWWQYTLKSELSENWFPKFFYQGGRYLQVELHPAPGETKLPVIEMLKGVVVHSSSTPVGDFSCSNQLFNRIYTLVRWAQRSNMMSIMTDCPAREKQGWLEELHLNGPALRYNFDMASLIRKAMSDMADAQLDNGLVPNIAPEFFHAGADINNGFRNSPEWGSSFIIVPWQQYLYSGDLSLMRDYFPQMKRYVAFLEATSKNNIVYTGLGDWYDIGPKPAWGSQLTPVSFTATAIYFYDNQIMAKMAALLGLKADAEMYMQKAENIRQAFNKEFYKQASNSYATGSNTTYAMPLYLNIADPGNRDALVKNLVADIHQQGNSFNSGEIGYRYLLGALAEAGSSDVIYDMNNQSDRPGYGYQLKMGATALTEKWDAGAGSSGSQNHFMSGEINEWFYNDLLGISPDETGAGFTKFNIKPAFLKTLNWVKGSYKSISGDIKCEWKRENGQLSVSVTVPVNTTATLFLPSDASRKINIGNENKGVKVIEQGATVLKLLLGSGNYHFTVAEK
ncbi:alpha-L-rhamnosidase [Mucilaginibacter paludis DSM 18603]|uniref:alpha-L-rhamnosidase n=2 Tax=Mucilaginibacter TaxID=423349 RepID=H1Y1Q8_9SPHI|nr:alpha-L-rhamnosidase [Mucilaginibacter paludis DSM 18603]